MLSAASSVHAWAALVKSTALASERCLWNAPGVMTASDIRARSRADLVTAIKAAATQQLAASGAASLSLRAVARELGLASSALYRYFPSRDALLTALLVDAYDAVGQAAEQADAAAGKDPGARWLAVCRAVRALSLIHI